MSTSNLYRLVYTQTCIESVHYIFLDIQISYWNRVAKNIQERIFRCIELLASHPYIDTLYGTDYRKLVVQKILLFYGIDTQNKVVFLMKAFELRQNWVHLF